MLKIAFYRDQGREIATRLDNRSAHPHWKGRPGRKEVDGDT